MSPDDLAARVRTASRSCAVAVSGRAFCPPAQALADLARACAELGIEEWDSYGEGGAVERLEAEVAELLGTQAAAFFPSGVMAQQAALRIHADRSGSRRVAMPDLSHLLLHEEDGPRILHGLEVSHLTRGFETPAARHVSAIPGRLAAVLVELPLREAGCLLPTWDELAALSQACRDRGAALHVDGAAALAGPAGFIAEARLWRRRLGGTVYRVTAEAVSALAGLRDQLATIPATVTWARALAAELPRCVTVQPGVSHTNQFLLYAAGDAGAVNQRVLSLVEERSIGLPAWRPAQEPGRVTAEVVVTSAALSLDPAAMAALLAKAVASGGE